MTAALRAERILADEIQRAQLADRLAAPGQHGQHHVVTAIGGGGERESQRRDQQSLDHAESVITPTGFAVVAGDTVVGKGSVVFVDKVVFDRCTQVWLEAGRSEVREITRGQTYSERLPIHHRHAGGVGREQQIVEAVVAVQQREPVPLGEQPGRHQTHCGGEGFPIGRAHSVTELVQRDLGTHSRHLAQTAGRRFVRSGEGDPGEVQPDGITPTGSVQSG